MQGVVQPPNSSAFVSDALANAIEVQPNHDALAFSSSFNSVFDVAILEYLLEHQQQIQRLLSRPTADHPIIDVADEHGKSWSYNGRNCSIKQQTAVGNC